MNIFRLVASLLILTLICSSALAISKGDLMSYYRTTAVSPANTGTTPALPEDVETLPPTPPSNSQDEAQIYAKWLKPSSSKPIFPSPGIGKPTVSPGESWMKKPSSSGFNPSPPPALMPEHDYSDHDDSDGSDCGPPITYIKVETERSGEVLTDSRTGEPYPVITDIRRNSYLAVEGSSG